MATNSFSESDKIFHSDGYHLGQTWAEKGNSLFNIVCGQTELYQSVDGLIYSLLAQAERHGRKTDCARGCSWCCYQPVFANSLEINCLGEYMRKNFPPDLTKETALKASQKNNRVSLIQESEILHHKSPCPLLNDGACMAYEARPMACRIYLSTSLRSCQLFFNDPGHAENFPALLEFPLRAGRMLNQGFTAAFRQNGFNVEEYRIEEGLDRYFNNLPC